MFIGKKGLANVVHAIIAVILSVVLSFVFTLIFLKETVVVKKQKEEKSSDNRNQVIVKNETIVSSLIGKFKKLDEVPDATFAKKMVGDGFAVESEEGKVFAPFNGTVETVSPTKHAIGLKSEDGIELLIHLGLNTVELKGKYFNTKLKAGDQIQKGQLLETFDIDKIKAAGYQMISPVIITNLNDLKGIKVKSNLNSVNNSTDVLTAIA